MIRRSQTPPRVAGRCSLAAVAVTVAACQRTPAPPPVPEPPRREAPADASAAAPTAPVTARSSETVATGKPEPACRDCDQPDGSAAAPTHGRPQMALDETMLADVRATIDATSEILEAGVTILEEHQRKPERAAPALRKWLDSQRKRVDDAFARAREVRARLASVGYDQDMPPELQQAFAARMEKVQQRLELMRTVYRNHIDALEAFGGFFPRPGPAATP